MTVAVCLVRLIFRTFRNNEGRERAWTIPTSLRGPVPYQQTRFPLPFLAHYLLGMIQAGDKLGF